MSTDVLSVLLGIVGPQGLRADADLSAYEVDWRKRYRGRALGVVQPASTEETAAVVRACAHHGVSLVPQGGNTGLVGGSVPDASGTQIVINMQRMKRVRHLDALNMSLCVEAGCTLHEVQQTAVAAGLLFPLSLASEGLCTIGGNLASNAGGSQVLRYGNARELCLGLEVVTPEGQVWNGLRALRKDNAGYDLRSLYIGSEGTLGIITAATLRLFPKPQHERTALLAVPSLDAALALIAATRLAFDASLTSFEIMNQASVALVRHHFPALCAGWPAALWDAPWLVLMALSDVQAPPPQHFHDFLQAQNEAGYVGTTVLPQDLSQQQRLWHLRESISSAQSLEGLNIKHDIALPLSSMSDFVKDTHARLNAHWPGLRPITFGHLGDGNLHYNLQAPAGQDSQEFLARHESSINRVVFDSVQAHGGSIAAEHGIGQLRRESLRHYAPTEAMDLMRKIKAALDPQNLFNPGRVV